MNSKNKKFVCIFDSSHFVDSEQKLIKHMAKCKAMQKDSYECCQYNPLHWVKYNTIKEHEDNCPDKDRPITKDQSFTNLLPAQISSYQFCQPFEIDISMLQSSSFNKQSQASKKQPKKEGFKEDPNMVKNQQKNNPLQKAKKVQMWKEPDFQEFLIRKGCKKNKVEKIQRRNQPQSFIANNQSFFL